jgi:drug/metabolite transporter (DMT)-like permease
MNRSNPLSVKTPDKKTASAHTVSQTSINLKGIPHLLVVYFVWGSTYLAIRLAVREGAGFPPFTLGYTRTLLAGAILLAWAGFSGQRLRTSRRELIILAVSGLLLWTGANGLVVVAEQRADSGLAALIVAAVPIWIAIIEAILDKRAPSWLLTTSLLVGFSGIGLLSAPVLMTGARADVLSVVALIVGGFSWSLGTVLQSRNQVDLSPQVRSGIQMLAGGLGFVVMAWLTGEPRPTPTAEAWLAWGYLVVFGSLLAFTSYVVALQLLPTSIVMTYPYVNPVIAVLLGWLILREPVTAWTIGGSLLVLLGVGGVFRDRYGKPGKPSG